MQPEPVERLLNEHSQHIQEHAQQRLADLEWIHTASLTTARGILTFIASLMCDERWQCIFTEFLDAVCAAAEQPANNWNDEERLAVALGGVLAFATLLKRL